LTLRLVFTEDTTGLANWEPAEAGLLRRSLQDRIMDQAVEKPRAGATKPRPRHVCCRPDRAALTGVPGAGRGPGAANREPELSQELLSGTAGAPSLACGAGA
jgi:hypothetical protein